MPSNVLVDRDMEADLNGRNPPSDIGSSRGKCRATSQANGLMCFGGKTFMMTQGP